MFFLLCSVVRTYWFPESNGHSDNLFMTLAKTMNDFSNILELWHVFSILKHQNDTLQGSLTVRPLKSYRFTQ